MPMRNVNGVVFNDLGFVKVETSHPSPAEQGLQPPPPAVPGTSPASQAVHGGLSTIKPTAEELAGPRGEKA